MLEMKDVVNAEYTFAEHEHRELAAGLGQIHVAAKTVRWITPTEMSASMRRVRDWISAVLLPHAAWEDAVVYPQIDLRTGTDWATKLMRFEHYQIERVASQLDADMEILRGTPTHDQSAEMRGHLFSLEALLRAHIEREELFLLPLLADN